MPRNSCGRALNVTAVKVVTKVFTRINPALSNRARGPVATFPEAEGPFRRRGVAGQTGIITSHSKHGWYETAGGPSFSVTDCLIGKQNRCGHRPPAPAPAYFQ